MHPPSTRARQRRASGVAAGKGFTWAVCGLLDFAAAAMTQP